MATVHKLRTAVDSEWDQAQTWPAPAEAATEVGFDPALDDPYLVSPFFRGVMVSLGLTLGAVVVGSLLAVVFA